MRTIHDLSAAERRIVTDLRQRVAAVLGGADFRMTLPRGMRPLVAHCHLGLGKLHRRTGKRQLGQEHFTAATTMYADMGMLFWQEQADRESKAL